MLSIALLVAQFGAEAHAYSHLNPDSQGIPSSTLECANCLSFAPVTLAAAGASAAVLHDAGRISHAAPACTIAFVSHSPFSAYQSRAPPQLL